MWVFKGQWFKTLEIFIVVFLLMAGSRLVVLKLAGGPMAARETGPGPELGVSVGISVSGVSEIVTGGETKKDWRGRKITAPVSLLTQSRKGVAPACNISARYFSGGGGPLTWIGSDHRLSCIGSGRKHGQFTTLNALPASPPENLRQKCTILPLSIVRSHTTDNVQAAFVYVENDPLQEIKAYH